MLRRLASQLTKVITLNRGVTCSAVSVVSSSRELLHILQTLQSWSPLNCMLVTNISHCPTRLLVPSCNQIQHHIRFILAPHYTSVGFPSLRRLVVYAIGRNTAKPNVFGFLRVCS
jgi:hypothetical protein